MAQERPPRRASPTSGALRKGWEKDMTEQFRQVLSTKRMNDLSRRSTIRHTSTLNSDPHHAYDLVPRHPAGHALHRDADLDNFTLGTAPASYSPLRNIPLIPAPPSDPQSQQFRNKLRLLSETPCKWENPGLLDEALKAIPLDRIYAAADEETNYIRHHAENMNLKPAWAWQDCVIRALLKWFKGSFFTWVNNPPCGVCGSPTIARGMAAPTPDERARGGNSVELYQCSHCPSQERFPRYNDAFVLLQTRKGRVGEWAVCFSMLCRAMGSRVRWVWNSEDYVWTEVYSVYRKRWVHVDAVEGLYDKPTLYTEGWKRKLAYCIAFSSDGAMDVTSRYCQNPSKWSAPRTKTPEAVLLYIMDEIRSLRRRNLEKPEKLRLEKEDTLECQELRHYYISTLIGEVAKLLPAGLRRVAADGDAQKARELAAERARARATGRMGTPELSKRSQ